jgi:polysaccharide export outer membrane protein
MTTLRTVTGMLAACALLAGCVSASSEPPPGTRMGALNAALDRGAGGGRHAAMRADYVVEAPDVLAIEVRGEDDLSVDAVTVGPDGRIHRPLVGSVDVAGRTVGEVESELSRRYTRFIRDVEVAVSVVEHRSKHVYVTGEVRRPGRYPYTGNDDVLSVIAQAGFLTRNAAVGDVQVARGRPGYTERLPVHLDDIVERGDASTNWRLQPDDVIHVPPGFLARISYAFQDVLAPFAVPVRVHSDD